MGRAWGGVGFGIEGHRRDARATLACVETIALRVTGGTLATVACVETRICQAL